MDIEVKTKLCPRCRQTLPLSDFHRARARRDGRASICKKCAVEATKRSQARQRAEMGEDGWAEHKRAISQRHRSTLESRPAYDQAYANATRRLRAAYPRTFARILQEERYKLGLDPK